MRIILVYLLLVLSLLSCRKGDSRLSFPEQVDSLFNTAPDFSGVALIAERGKPLYWKSWGYKNFVTHESLDTNAVFELASLSKQFTAMVIIMLRERGKLDYDDLVTQYLPELPYAGVTIRHLLNHTSGLPDYQAIMDEHWDKSRIASNSDNIAYLVRYRPEIRFAPGEKYEYSNTGYMLLATIAERVSGKDFVALSRELIFEPLGMSGTGIRTKTEKLGMPQMAWGHIYVDEESRYVPADSFPEFNYTIWLGNRVGPGRVSSTAADLLRWDQALRNGSLIQPVSLMEAFSPARLNNDSLSYYGFGWRIERNPVLGKAVRHSGDNPGYKTHILRYLNDETTLILLCNNAHEKFGRLLTGMESLLVQRATRKAQ